MIAVASAAAILVAVLSGPFGTAALPLATRALVWATLIAWNAAKWWAWYRLAGPRMPADTAGTVALPVIGALLLNATVPLEVAFVYRAVGLDISVTWLPLWLSAVMISAGISAVVAVAWQPSTDPGPPADHPAEPATPPRGLALKADLSRLNAITAEDHYLRLHMAGGERPLILYRFGDAMADLAGLDGLQVHRSAWVAAGAIDRADRVGRRWWLVLADGTRVPVSERHLPAVRARGWLRNG